MSHFLEDTVKMILNLALVIFTGLLSGCGTLSDGKRWGQDATLFPGWQRVGNAAVRAALSPGTWIPAAGAAGFQIGHFDENLSDWALDRTPVFGSRENAGNATDTIGTIADIELYLSILLTPDGDEPKEWAVSKVKGAVVDFAALRLNDLATDSLKGTTKRTRPNGSDDRSFPSSLASSAATSSTLAYENIKCFPIPQTAKTVIGIGSTALCALGGWGRVEAGAHYPSDVLAGLSLGHFLALFVQDAFLGIDGERFWVEAEPIGGGLVLTVIFEW